MYIIDCLAKHLLKKILQALGIARVLRLNVKYQESGLADKVRQSENKGQYNVKPTKRPVPG